MQTFYVFFAVTRNGYVGNSTQFYGRLSTVKIYTLFKKYILSVLESLLKGYYDSIIALLTSQVKYRGVIW